jgi:hypothetical protein
MMAGIREVPTMPITQTIFIACEFRRCSIDRSRVEPLTALPAEFAMDAAVIRDGTVSDCHMADVVAYGCEFIDCHFDEPTTHN